MIRSRLHILADLLHKSNAVLFSVYHTGKRMMSSCPIVGDVCHVSFLDKVFFIKLLFFHFYLCTGL